MDGSLVARRIARGFALPLRVTRELLRDPAQRSRWIRLMIAQLVAIALGVGVSIWGWLELQALLRELRRTEPEVQIEIAGGLPGVLYAVTSICEWVVVALTHDFYDQQTRHSCLRAGIEPEDSEIQPRVRVDLRWMRTKMRRRLHGFLILGYATLASSLLLWPLALLPLIGGPLLSLVTPAWAFYWLAVFTVGKTAHAWTPHALGEPWFLRAELLDKFWPMRWWGPRLLTRWFRRVVGLPARPARRAEVMPWEAVGLGLLRLVCGLPGVYPLFRGAVPVASALLLREHGLLAAPAPGSLDTDAASNVSRLD